LSFLIQSAVDRELQSNAFELPDYDGQKFKKVSISVQADSEDLSLRIFSRKQMRNSSPSFSTKNFLRAPVSVENTLIKQLYAHSSAGYIADNNQVIVLTRLPRGSLDELLKNAKAESK
jgi:hypothetical protein